MHPLPSGWKDAPAAGPGPKAGTERTVGPAATPSAGGVVPIVRTRDAGSPAAQPTPTAGPILPITRTPASDVLPVARRATETIIHKDGRGGLPPRHARSGRRDGRPDQIAPQARGGTGGLRIAPTGAGGVRPIVRSPIETVIEKDGRGGAPAARILPFVRRAA